MKPPVRNALIVVALAAIVFAVPHGTDRGQALRNAFSTGINVCFVILIGRFYLEHRLERLAFGQRWLNMLYAAGGGAVFLLAARERLLDTNAGIFVWFVLVGIEVYLLFALYGRFRALRDY